MADLSQRLREPVVLTLLVIAAVGWVAFLAMWINAMTQSGTQQEAIATLTQERDAANRQLTERAAAAGSLQDVQAQLLASQREMDTVTASLETAQADWATRQEELATLEEALANRRSEATALDDQLANTTQQVTELETRQQQLQADIESGTAQLADIGVRLEEARALEATTTANVARYTEEAAQATAGLAETQTQLQAAREQLTAAQEQMADLASQTETAGQELATLQQQLAELEAHRDTLEDEVQSYQAQRDELQPQVEQLTQTLADRSEELSAVESELADALARSDGASVVGRYSVASEGNARDLALSLQEDGRFTLNGQRGRSVSGTYVLDDEQLRLTDVSGDLGNATFPMSCPVTRTEVGFEIGEAEACPLAGLQFERVP